MIRHRCTVGSIADTSGRHARSASPTQDIGTRTSTAPTPTVAPTSTGRSSSPLATTVEELRAGLTASDADYLPYGKVDRRFRPELEDDLGDPAAASGWLAHVFTSAVGVSVLYRIALPAPGE